MRTTNVGRLHSQTRFFKCCASSSFSGNGSASTTKKKPTCSKKNILTFVFCQWLKDLEHDLNQRTLGFPERKKKKIKQLACQVLFLPLITRKSFCFDFPISYFPEHACPPVTRYKIGGTTREIGVSGVVNFETISS